MNKAIIVVRGDFDPPADRLNFLDRLIPQSQPDTYNWEVLAAEVVLATQAGDEDRFIVIAKIEAHVDTAEELDDFIEEEKKVYLADWEVVAKELTDQEYDYEARLDADTV